MLPPSGRRTGSGRPESRGPRRVGCHAAPAERPAGRASKNHSVSSPHRTSCADRAHTPVASAATVAETPGVKVNMPCAAHGCSWARKDPWRRPDRRTPGQALQARRGLLQRHVLCSWPVEHASTLDRTFNGGSGYPRKACVAASPGSRVAHYRPFLAVIQTHQGPTGRKLR